MPFFSSSLSAQGGGGGGGGGDTSSVVSSASYCSTGTAAAAAAAARQRQHNRNSGTASPQPPPPPPPPPAPPQPPPSSRRHSGRQEQRGSRPRLNAAPCSFRLLVTQDEGDQRFVPLFDSNVPSGTVPPPILHPQPAAQWAREPATSAGGADEFTMQELLLLSHGCLPLRLDKPVTKTHWLDLTADTSLLIVTNLFRTTVTLADGGVGGGGGGGEVDVAVADTDSPVCGAIPCRTTFAAALIITLQRDSDSGGGGSSESATGATGTAASAQASASVPALSSSARRGSVPRFSSVGTFSAVDDSSYMYDRETARPEDEEAFEDGPAGEERMLLRDRRRLLNAVDAAMHGRGGGGTGGGAAGPQSLSIPCGGAGDGDGAATGSTRTSLPANLPCDPLSPPVPPQDFREGVRALIESHFFFVVHVLQRLTGDVVSALSTQLSLLRNSRSAAPAASTGGGGEDLASSVSSLLTARDGGGDRLAATYSGASSASGSLFGTGSSMGVAVAAAAAAAAAAPPVGLCLRSKGAARIRLRMFELQPLASLRARADAATRALSSFLFPIVANGVAIGSAAAPASSSPTGSPLFAASSSSTSGRALSPPPPPQASPPSSACSRSSSSSSAFHLTGAGGGGGGGGVATDVETPRGVEADSSGDERGAWRASSDRLAAAAAEAAAAAAAAATAAARAPPSPAARGSGFLATLKAFSCSSAVDHHFVSTVVTAALMHHHGWAGRAVRGGCGDPALPESLRRLARRTEEAECGVVRGLPHCRFLVCGTDYHAVKGLVGVLAYLVAPSGMDERRVVEDEAETAEAEAEAAAETPVADDDTARASPATAAADEDDDEEECKDETGVEVPSALAAAAAAAAAAPSPPSTCTPPPLPGMGVKRVSFTDAAQLLAAAGDEDDDDDDDEEEGAAAAASAAVAAAVVAAAAAAAQGTWWVRGLLEAGRGNPDEEGATAETPLQPSRLHRASGRHPCGSYCHSAVAVSGHALPFVILGTLQESVSDEDVDAFLDTPVPPWMPEAGVDTCVVVDVRAKSCYVHERNGGGRRSVADAPTVSQLVRSAAACYAHGVPVADCLLSLHLGQLELLCLAACLVESLASAPSGVGLTTEQLRSSVIDLGVADLPLATALGDSLAESGVHALGADSNPVYSLFAGGAPAAVPRLGAYELTPFRRTSVRTNSSNSSFARPGTPTHSVY